MIIYRILILAIAMLSLSASAFAENDGHVKTSKGWWQFGVSYRGGSPMIYHSEHAFVAGAGYRFNKKNYLGLNVGAAKAVDTFTGYGPENDFEYVGCPISLDYTHNFFLGKAKKHSIYLGGEVGGTFSFGQEAEIPMLGGPNQVVQLGIPVFMVKTGMDFQLYERLHINFGARIGFLGGQGSIGFTF